MEAATGFEPVNNGFAVLKIGVSRRKQEQLTFNFSNYLAFVLLCRRKQELVAKTR